MEPFAFTNPGVIPNPPDGRDWLLGSVQAPIPVPDTYKPDAFFALKPLMQAKTSACGGFSLAQLIQYFTFLRTGNPVALSPRFAYMAEKSVDGLPGTPGTTLRAIGQAAKNLGVCLDSLVTDDTTLPDPQYGDFGQASNIARSDALSRIEPSYLFLDDVSIGGIKRAIYRNRAVILEIKVGKEWWTAPDGSLSWAAADVVPLRLPSPAVSSHFMVFGAYEPDPSGKTRIWGINSWSDGWGQGGFNYFLDDYAPYIIGGIAIADVPQSVQKVLGHAALDAEQKQGIVRQILADMSQAADFISREIGKL